MADTSTSNPAPLVIPVWPGGAPGSEDGTQQERTIPSAQGNRKVVLNVVQPTLTAFFPKAADVNGTAVVVCPGGGFHFLAIDYEGTDAAAWLTARGITAFVLKYRLLPTGDDYVADMARNRADPQRIAALRAGLLPLVLADGQQAMRVVRSRAAEWGLAADRIGIMGFSAGGAVAVGVALEHDAASRPDFTAAIYAGHYGDVPVPADAAPLFIACAADDPKVPAAGSVRLYSDWQAAGHSAELHIYAQGDHGFGMKKLGLPVDTWIERFGDWLQGQGLVPQAGLS